MRRADIEKLQRFGKGLKSSKKRCWSLTGEFTCPGPISWRQTKAEISDSLKEGPLFYTPLCDSWSSAVLVGMKFGN